MASDRAGCMTRPASSATPPTAAVDEGSPSARSGGRSRRAHLVDREADRAAATAARSSLTSCTICCGVIRTGSSLEPDDLGVGIGDHLLEHLCAGLGADQLEDVGL